MNYIKIEELENKVLVITIDCPDTKVNKVSTGLLDEIDQVLTRRIEEEDIKGLAILSAKEDNFVVGADIDELKTMQSRQQIIDYIEKAHNILNRIEALPIPVVVGIHGNCLGGGLELALVADYRLVSNSTATVLGLPEVQLGLLPAAGGTERLPRLIGIKESLPMMLTAKNVRAKKAKKLGLIDEITHPHGLRDAAIQKASTLSKNGPTKNKLGTNKLGNKNLPPIDALLDANSIGNQIVFKQAKDMVMKQSHGLYPAPLTIIDSVKYGYKNGVENGLQKDVHRFADLVMSPESKSLMHLFSGMTELKKHPTQEKSNIVNKLAVLGAGLMGNGIATVSAPLCETILLKDVSLEAAGKGMKEIAKSLAIQAKSGSITPFEKDAMYGKIVPCADYASFKNTDLIIEAVFEDLDLKKKILRDVEEATNDQTIFASNTSALPIHAIAEGCQRPPNVIGMHYFSPVHRMPLLEIITTDQTADWVTATALDFGIKQGKTCIVVKDGPGFYTTRILAPLLNEAVLLIEEGAKADDIDRAMLDFGYPVGPVTLLDEVGIDVGAHVSEGLGKMFQERGAQTSDSLALLFEKGFLGKKNNKGFYDYNRSKRNGLRQVNKEVYRIMGNQQRRKMDSAEIQDRISLMMINEAVLCLEEGIISSPKDGDVGAILGLGFPPFRGGPFRYIDTMGPGKIADLLEYLNNKYAPRFTPSQMLLDMASKNRRFYE